ncbi:MAG: FprA family A-type flavoprotein [Bacteroidales bacterium]|nr:FprA family A-type flavoprotein [Bacteroidales bacterium]MCF8327416.1 FprA family A-type flavoprotein [Bacteroidales bacterium]
MDKDNQVLNVTDDVKWIGVLDEELETFDVVMETEYGTTYNSFFINAEKKAIVETSKEKFWDVYKEKILQVTNPEEIEYIILNHTEPDHSGNLKNLKELAPNAKVVASPNAIRYLKDLFKDSDFEYVPVKDGHTLDLGNKTVRFISAPNLHWPDTMYSYLEEDKVLFTCDSFGAHYCDEKMFDDLVDEEKYDDAFRYYFNVILKPFGKFMLKAIDKIKDLEIDAIATGHGPILRSNWQKYVELSRKWSEEFLEYPQKHRVFIPYVSAYDKTALLAAKIAEGIRTAGEVEANPMDIELVSLGDLESEITKANGIIVGSPTINQNILLPIYKLFGVLTPLRDMKKLSGGFGSYGWSGEGASLIKNGLTSLKMKYFKEGVFVKFTPDNQELDKAFQYGKEFGEELLKN